MCLKITHMLTFVVVQNVSYHGDRSISEGGGDGGGVAGKQAAKPVNAVQDCVSTPTSRTPLDIKVFSILVYGTKIFLSRPVSGDHSFLCLNLTRP